MFNVGILTISDKCFRGEREDGSGNVIREMITQIGGQVAQYKIVPDEQEDISDALILWADGGAIDLILTNGGTGLSPRDITPEATLSVVNRLAPGFSEVMRSESMKKTPLGMLSRGVSGILAKTLIINLPGSPKAVRECLEAILPALPHALQTLRGEVSECANPAQLPTREL